MTFIPIRFNSYNLALFFIVLMSLPNKLISSSRFRAFVRRRAYKHPSPKPQFAILILLHPTRYGSNLLKPLADRLFL